MMVRLLCQSGLVYHLNLGYPNGLVYIVYLEVIIVSLYQSHVSSKWQQFTILDAL